MYESFYGFSRKPFALAPDPSFIFLSHGHQQALATLEYALESQAGFCVLSGEVGCGKTTIVRHLLNRLEPAIAVGFITNTSPGFGRLLQWASMAFGLEFAGRDDATLYQTFVDFLVKEYAAGRRSLLIVDEAQNLDAKSLEELRVLSNINSEQDVLLQTVLVGQPELKTLMGQRSLSQLTQRVAVDCHLEPLSERDASRYVWHRLRVAGGPISIFTPHAIREIYGAALGVPRLINQVCDLALVYGYAERKTTISSHLVRAVIRERLKTGVLPLHSTASGRYRDPAGAGDARQEPPASRSMTTDL